MKTNLSKSKYLVGLQCPKRLWLESYRRELLPPIPAAKERVFSQGYEVGLLARERFPGGVLINEDPFHWQAALEGTRRALATDASAFFEPCFFHDDTIARADILTRNADGSFDLIEVKSTTHSKEEHVWDLAVQTYVYEGAGLRINRAFLMHLNRDCRHPDLSNLFAMDDLTKDMRKHLGEIPGNLATFKAVLASDAEPSIRLGSRCFSPYECSFFDYCSKLWKLPEVSVFNIPYLGADKRDALIERDILDLHDLPPDADIGSRGETFVRLFLSGSRSIDDAGIRSWFSGLTFPLYFLDFETDGPAIPRLPGLGPFGSIPFQFSLHVLHEDGRLIEAEGFLHTDQSDSRSHIASALVDQIGPVGSIIAYNASFEKRVITELSAYLPDLAQPLQAFLPRFADLLDVFRKYYIDPAFKGSNSIKAVLPVLCPDLSYKTLEVRNGEDAQAAWARLISCEDSEEKARLAHGLRTYCGLDTLAMVRIYQVLSDLIK
jgi:hypothetical protein